MNKLIPLVIVSLLLTACGQSKEQLGLKEALVNKLSGDSDLKDYKLTPNDVADCVVAAIEENAPGIPGDQRRARYFEAFTKFVAVNSPADAEKATSEYKDLFGGDIKQTRQAALTVTDYIMSCMGSAIESRGE